ncbi:M3 family oligoendopeptidase [Desulfogranum japonicum]|uniref:M3 family oligoendopeptidase n=1 Tax=Desulfogranum japonicum TaxID=231447 RepID=UPI0004216FCB|nr:M3 family oligoendopeptidase [Desulfogranum japonicum]
MSTAGNVSLKVENVVWDLHDLYAGAEDPQLLADIQLCSRQAEELHQQYFGTIASRTANELFTLLSVLEKNDALLGRLSTYAFLHFTTQTSNDKASALLQKIEELAAEVGRRTIFFRLEWNRIEESLAHLMLAAPELVHYRYYLENLRKFAPHQLSGPEEELLQQFGPVGRSAWVLLFDKIMANMKFGEKKRTEEEVLSDLHSSEPEVRKQAADDMTHGLQDNLHILTHIFNTLASEKMITDRVRKYPGWCAHMDLENGLESHTVDTLIQVVVSRYDLVEKYYRLKKNILAVDTLFDFDRYAPIPTSTGDQLVDWQQCQRMVLEAFQDFSGEMHDIALLFFEKNWIHAPVAEGKRGGAFAHPCVPGVHPYVMVNYTGGMRDVSTVAHELGHGVHQYLAAKQGLYNSDTPLVLAETASVFAEFLVFKKQLQCFDSAEEKRAFICQKIESIFATVFRQVAMNRFEHQMHTRRKDQGELAGEEFAQIWIETQQAMFGDSVQLTENYRVWWSYIPHFLSTPGYVYSYAFGELLVLSLYSQYEEQGEKFVGNYLELLRSGGKDSPYSLLTPFGIDLDQPSFWQGGMKIIEELLSQVLTVSQ